MVSAVLQSANHDPEVWHTAGLPRRVELPLFVHAPYWVTSIGHLVTENLAHRVDSVGETSGQNHQVVFLLSAAVEHDAVFREANGITLFNLDLAVDDGLAGTGIEVETTILGVTESVDASVTLTPPDPEACLLHFGDQLHISIPDVPGRSAAELFGRTDRQAVV